MEELNRKKDSPLALFFKDLLFTLIVPGTGGVYVPLWLTQGHSPASGLAFIRALVLLFIGGAIYVWCVWNFAAYGHGTPSLNDSPKKLVIRGLYRYVRNPIYVGALFVLTGWMVMFGGMNLVLYTILLAIGFHLVIVFYEEPHLKQKFGAEYVDYCNTVGRWLPRLSRQ